MTKLIYTYEGPISKNKEIKYFAPPRDAPDKKKS